MLNVNALFRGEDRLGTVLIVLVKRLKNIKGSSNVKLIRSKGHIN